ncbi:TetR/AcrR family transcriptional regulator [Flavobacterium sp. 3HN19-14]|uniref:TetR/AcrR family transcriptional regulator n=1 Tax=Flavobacterium sp. 3HN19-14 TaxID=3448133 RepID=UPI003EDEB9C7
MVSYYFGSKERMLESLIYFRISDLKMQLENIVRQEVTPLEKINMLIDLYMKRIQKNRCMYKILHFELSSKMTIDIKAFTEVKKDNLESLRKIITEGQQKGDFVKDINVELIPPTIMGTFFHVDMNRPFYEELFGWKTQEDFDNYTNNELSRHIKKTIKALLLYES